MALAVAMNERLGHSTSSSGLTPAASRAKCKAVVHEDTAIAKGAPMYSAKRRSNSSTRGPWLTQPLLSTSTTAGSHVEHFVHHVALRSQQVRTSNIFDENEIHRLRAISKNERWLIRFDCFKPADQHLGIDTHDVHARTVHVEITERNIRETEGCVVGTEHLFAGDLPRAIHGSIVKGMAFVHREIRRLSIDGCGRGSHKLLNSMVNSGL